MSSQKPKGTLAAAFGVDVDELGQVEDITDTTVEQEPQIEDLPDISVEVEPGIVRYGHMEFIRQGENLIPLNSNVQVNFTFTAIERHRLKSFADANRMTMVEVVREALKAYVKGK